MKIFCIGRNYADHAKELNNPVPVEPLVFIKPSTAFNNKQELYYPAFTKDLHYEAEIVLKIIKNGKYVKEKFAPDYFDEISLGIDFTARDLQSKLKSKGHPWEKAKGFDQSAPVGTSIPKHKFQMDNIPFSLNKNGKQVQVGNTKDLIFSFEKLIVHISQFFTLQIGDYIFTGTPAGVGPVAIGDHLEGYIGDQKTLDFSIK